jgi:hypothetical protein
MITGQRSDILPTNLLENEQECSQLNRDVRLIKKQYKVVQVCVTSFKSTSQTCTFRFW